jgi:MIP family channel proteins
MSDTVHAPASAVATAGEPVTARVAAAGRMPATSAGLYGSSTAQNVPRLAAAEFIGTFFLVFAGTAEASAAALKLTIAGQPADSLAVGLTFGLTLVALVYTFGHISGCHLNPAVTLGLAVSGKFPWKHTAYYIASQLAGAVTASLAVWGTLGERARSAASLGATQPAAHSSGLDVFVIEAVMTFFLVLVICSVATDRRAHPAVAGIAVGFTLAVCVLVAGPVSGGAINPARALGPMIVAAKYQAIWAYVLGPIAGGGLGALLYEKFLATAQAPGSAEASEPAVN